MAMFPALMNDTMFSDLFDDPFFEGWRNTDNTMSAVMPANMMTTDVRETDKGYASTSICLALRRKISTLSSTTAI